MPHVSTLAVDRRLVRHRQARAGAHLQQSVMDDAELLHALLVEVLLGDAVLVRACSAVQSYC